MKPNEVIDKMTGIINKCQEYRKKALKEYQTETESIKRDQYKMTPEEYRRLRLNSMRSYSETTKTFCLATIAACEAVIRQLEGDNPYKAVYSKRGDMAIWNIEERKKGGKGHAAKQSRAANAGHGGRDPVR